MEKIKDFLVKMVTSNSGISSKRVCGVIGFLVIVFAIIFCTVNVIQVPEIVETFIWAVALLLGVDSITDIFKNKIK